ncbi:hypothetical protein ACJJTC_013798 [Scirpophaga incertulas]
MGTGHNGGTTRLLLTKIPYYKNVVIMSFSCEACGYENNEIQPGGAYAELGVRWKIHVSTQRDLNRQSQKGEVTTVEGIITRAIAGLTQDQQTRRIDHPEAAGQIDAFVARLEGLKGLETAWTLELEDISGNCFVENPDMPRKDPHCKRTEFKRTKDQNHTLGVFTHDEVSDCPAAADTLFPPVDPEDCSYDKLAADEILNFRTNCPDCNAPADTHMKVTNIPYFKEVVIMATICDACGHRTNEVKSGGGIEDKGVRFELRVASKEDFSRDILKSETCSMEIPELQLEVGGRALGGRFTTAEGLLTATMDQLGESPGVLGDAPALANDSMDRFIDKLKQVLSCERPVTIILDDPAGNSYVQSLSDDPGQPDEGLKITRYERTFEQNEELGLNDMKTEAYEDS